MKKICKHYTGIACIDGNCPKANEAEYRERCMPITKNCNECPYYKGCEDCVFFETEICNKN